MSDRPGPNHHSNNPPPFPDRAPGPPTAMPSSPPVPKMPTEPEEWEQVRRSVAMLPPNAWAMRREQSLAALTSLINLLRR